MVPVFQKGSSAEVRDAFMTSSESLDLQGIACAGVDPIPSSGRCADHPGLRSNPGSRLRAPRHDEAIERRQHQAQNVSAAAMRLHKYRVNRGAT
jgi:hypothetical protein